MRIVSFVTAGQRRLGFVSGGNVIDALAALAPGDAAARAMFADATALIRAGAEGRALAERLIKDAPAAARLALASVTLTAPMLPTTILCSGSNYIEHNQEKANTPISGKEPEFFIKTADCVVGPDEPIVLDERVTKKMDCECELAIVIGKAGRHIPVARAGACVRLHHRQRRHRARPAGAENARWRDVLRARPRQGVRYQRADRAGHRQRRRGRRSARAGGEDEDQWRSQAVEQHVAHDLELRRADPLLLR